MVDDGRVTDRDFAVPCGAQLALGLTVLRCHRTLGWHQFYRTLIHEAAPTQAAAVTGQGEAAEVLMVAISWTTKP